MRSVTVEGSHIVLVTGGADRHLAGGLPGARWNAAHRGWTLPATPACAEAIVTCWPDALTLSDQRFQDLWLDACARLEVRTRPALAEADYDHYMRPWAHQVEATRFARDMDVGLLHMWMGCGKTVCTLNAARARGHRRILIVCPKSVIPVWETETQKHAPGQWKVLRLEDGSVARRAAALRRSLHAEEPLIAVVNYEATWRVPLSECVWKISCCDRLWVGA